MANISLESIEFPDIDNIYTVFQLDSSLTFDNYAAESSAVGAALDTKADKDGTYPDLTAGLADMATQLKSTVGITDEEPYLFRTSGGSADIGDFETDKIVGGTVAWNQLVPDAKIHVSTTIAEDVTEHKWGENIATLGGSIVGHVIFAKSKLSNAKCLVAWGNNNTNFVNGLNSAETTQSEGIYRTNSIVGNGTIYFRLLAGLTAGTHTADIQLFDLTAMFGFAIADYIYSLEQATAGAGVAWFRKLFPKPFYQYNPGTLIHVGNISKHRMVGFNQWDEEWRNGYYVDGNFITNQNYVASKNPCKCLPNTEYYAYIGTSSGRVVLDFYDADMQYIGVELVRNDVFTTPSNAHWFNLYIELQQSAYQGNVCINLSWDGERDGEYAPYVAYEYPLDADFYLLGIPKLDANNHLYFDGDEYASDGTVTQRYGMVDLGTLNWTRYSFSGNYCFYVKLATIKPANANGICVKYDVVLHESPSRLADKKILLDIDTGEQHIYIKDDTYSDAATFKAAMSGVYLVYERAEPMYAQVDPFENPQRVDDFGTEEYVAEPFGTNDVILPVGHSTFYQANLRAKLEMLPNSPDGDGDYIVRQASGENTYVPLVIPPAVQVVEKFIEFSPAVSVAAGDVYSAYNDNIVPESITGYTPKMVTVKGTNSLALIPLCAYISSDNSRIMVDLRNITDQAVSLTSLSVDILYVKST